MRTKKWIGTKDLLNRISQKYFDQNYEEIFKDREKEQKVWKLFRYVKKRQIESEFEWEF